MISETPVHMFKWMGWVRWSG